MHALIRVGCLSPLFSLDARMSEAKAETRESMSTLGLPPKGPRNACRFVGARSPQFRAQRTNSAFNCRIPSAACPPSSTCAQHLLSPSSPSPLPITVRSRVSCISDQTYWLASHTYLHVSYGAGPRRETGQLMPGLRLLCKLLPPPRCCMVILITPSESLQHGKSSASTLGHGWTSLRLRRTRV